MSQDVPGRTERGATRRVRDMMTTGNAKATSGVFVVDDDPDILAIAVAALRDEGCAVRGARDGREALDALRAQADTLPGLILLDLMMGFMDGREFRLELLRDPMLAAIPVVPFTADPSGLRDAVTMQVEAILTKPVTLEQILLVSAQQRGIETEFATAKR